MSAQLETPLLMSLARAGGERECLKAAGKRLVFTNGCFDLLHPGHVHYLRNARSLGDVLWIALNSDASVAALKGPTRPVMTLAERAFQLSALSFVDGLIAFDRPRLVEEILVLRPDIYVKAGDYTLETLHAGEREALQSVGAEIRFLPFLKGYSTTQLIGKIAKAAATFGFTGMGAEREGNR